jgi:hypothetical protein
VDLAFCQLIEAQDGLRDSAWTKWKDYERGKITSLCFDLHFSFGCYAFDSCGRDDATGW